MYRQEFTIAMQVDVTLSGMSAALPVAEQINLFWIICILWREDVKYNTTKQIEQKSYIWKPCVYFCREGTVVNRKCTRHYSHLICGIRTKILNPMWQKYLRYKYTFLPHYESVNQFRIQIELNLTIQYGENMTIRLQLIVIKKVVQG